METASILLRCLPFFLSIAYGVYSLLEIYFPSLRDQNFNRWQIDDNTGSYVEYMGWRKVLRPPRIIAQGYLSEGMACVVAFSAGIVLIAIGVWGVHEVAGIP
jgi:hypothetical protein